jgi:VanZ family protein
MKDLILKHPATASVTWAVVILILCATPGEYIPSEDWMELLSVDKLIHALMFFILCTLFFITSVRYQKPRMYATIFFFAAVIYGISLELMQATLFRNRSADWKDVVANTFGCVVALMLFGKIRKLAARVHG